MSKESVNSNNFASQNNNQGAKLKSVPIWYDGKTINEIVFCEEFLKKYRLIYCDGICYYHQSEVRLVFVMTNYYH